MKPRLRRTGATSRCGRPLQIGCPRYVLVPASTLCQRACPHEPHGYTHTLTPQICHCPGPYGAYAGSNMAQSDVLYGCGMVSRARQIERLAAGCTIDSLVSGVRYCLPLAGAPPCELAVHLQVVPIGSHHTVTLSHPLVRPVRPRWGIFGVESALASVSRCCAAAACVKPLAALCSIV